LELIRTNWWLLFWFLIMLNSWSINTDVYAKSMYTGRSSLGVWAIIPNNKRLAMFVIMSLTLGFFINSQLTYKQVRCQYISGRWLYCHALCLSSNPYGILFNFRFLKIFTNLYWYTKLFVFVFLKYIIKILLIIASETILCKLTQADVQLLLIKKKKIMRKN
jgi:hypothetical protein